MGDWGGELGHPPVREETPLYFILAVSPSNTNDLSMISLKRRLKHHDL